MRRAFRCVLVASLVLIGADAAARNHGGTRLGGIIIHNNGRPAVGAQVVLERSDGSAPLATRTDSNGAFLFKYIRSGLYDVRASSRGSASVWKHNVLVRAGRETTLTLRLEPIRH